jgi:hypothetical protein
MLEYHDGIEIRKVQALTGERSLTLVLPKQFAIKLGVGRGDFMKCRVESGSLLKKWCHREMMKNT